MIVPSTSMEPVDSKSPVIFMFFVMTAFSSEAGSASKAGACAGGSLKDVCIVSFVSMILFSFSIGFVIASVLFAGAGLLAGATGCAASSSTRFATCSKSPSSFDNSVSASISESMVSTISFAPFGFCWLDASPAGTNSSSASEKSSLKSLKKLIFLLLDSSIYLPKVPVKTTAIPSFAAQPIGMIALHAVSVSYRR